jgi:hypothetical protein
VSGCLGFQDAPTAVAQRFSGGSIHDSQAVQDEYDDYVRECLRLIDHGEVTQGAIVQYLETVIVGSMGMTKAAFNGLDPAEFAQRIMAQAQSNQDKP